MQKLSKIRVVNIISQNTQMLGTSEMGHYSYWNSYYNIKNISNIA